MPAAAKPSIPAWVADNPLVGSSITPSNPIPPAAGASKAPSDPPASGGEPDGKAAKDGAAPAAAAEPSAAKATADPAPHTPAGEEEKWPRTAKDWDAFKAKRREREDALKRERDELAAELAKAKATPATPADQDQLATRAKQAEEAEKRAADLESRLRAADLANHPRFKQYYESRFTAQVNRAKTLVPDEQKASVESLLNMPPGAARDSGLEALFQDISPHRAAQVVAIMERLDELKDEREGELRNARENWQKLELDRQSAEKARLDNISAGVRRTIDAWAQSPEVKTLLKDSDVEQAKKTALVGTGDTGEMARIIAKGVAFPRAVAALAARDKRIAELESEIKKLETANPRGSAPKPEASPENIPIKRSSDLRPGALAKMMVDRFVEAGMR